MSGVEYKAVEEPVIRLGISTCLLGERVRFDGGHKLDRLLTGTLGCFVEWVPVCPEVEIGMGVPRESIDLVGTPEAPHLVAKSGRDYTVAMQTWARERLEQLASPRLHGYILKADSPSCGLCRVRVYDENGVPQRTGRGIFAQELVTRFALLPVEEEGGLNDMSLRENFVKRVFAYYRWTRMLDEDPTPGGLVRFHTALKLTLMAHSLAHYQEMARLAAEAGVLPWGELTAAYGALLMEGLAVLGEPDRHAGVLQHLVGFLEDYLSTEDREELLGLVKDYQQGLVPLIVPITLIQHYIRCHPVPDWVRQQVYLSPYPKERMLCNHA